MVDKKWFDPMTRSRIWNFIGVAAPRASSRTGPSPQFQMNHKSEAGEISNIKVRPLVPFAGSPHNRWDVNGKFL